MKLKCNNCGKTIESGLLNVINHAFEECVKTEVKLSNQYTAVYRPFISLTPIQESKNHQTNVET
jgi:hypothetical protein